MCVEKLEYMIILLINYQLENSITKIILSNIPSH